MESIGLFYCIVSEYFSFILCIPVFKTKNMFKIVFRDFVESVRKGISYFLVAGK